MELYEHALDCGIRPEDFWTYSPLEVSDLIASYFRQKQQDIKQRVTHDFVMAEVQTRYVCREQGQDIPHPWEYYPELFQKEKLEYKQKKEAAELEEYKENRRSYVAEFNRRRRQGL